MKVNGLFMKHSEKAQIFKTNFEPIFFKKTSQKKTTLGSSMKRTSLSKKVVIIFLHILVQPLLYFFKNSETSCFTNCLSQNAAM
jgi:hypothetical protein